ncbi:hypothetical protein FBU59_003902 [Linderina macrospora]|uniref:Uncharacterized protein n=1 Tax=Linderina macrospora TaxID=4868 RepID=A0ACC1J740_9FUNG|nr:hypothetical protein FBU59_003902 [Linderina macrospora]
MTVVHINDLSIAQRLSLKHGGEALASEFICLASVREPLGRMGGYWNLDSESITNITAGTLKEAVKGIQNIISLFQEYDGDVEPGCETDVRMKNFIQRADAWIRVNTS